MTPEAAVSNDFLLFIKFFTIHETAKFVSTHCEIYTQNQCGSSMILVWNWRGLDHKIGRNRW